MVLLGTALLYLRQECGVPVVNSRYSQEIGHDRRILSKAVVRQPDNKKRALHCLNALFIKGRLTIVLYHLFLVC